MSNKVKDINIKTQICYLFNDLISAENVVVNNIKIDKKSLKNVLLPILDI